MSYAQYTDRLVSGYRTPLMARHNLSTAMFLQREDLVRQEYATETNLPPTDLILMGSRQSWVNGPLSDTPLTLEYGELNMEVQISSVTVNSVTTVTVQPGPTPAGLSRPLKFTTFWGDGTDVVNDERMVVAGGPAYSFTAPTGIKPGTTDVNFVQMYVEGPTSASGLLEHFFTQPFSYGPVTIRYDNLRLENDYMVVDWQFTSGSLNGATSEYIYVALCSVTDGYLQITPNGWNLITASMGSSGTLALNSGVQVFSGGELQPYLYRAFTNGSPDEYFYFTDPLYYVLITAGYDRDETRPPGQAIQVIAPTTTIGHIPTSLSQMGFYPFTRNYLSGVVYPEPITETQTLVFDWNPGATAT